MEFYPSTNNANPKKILIVAHNSRFIVQFELGNIALLQSMGYEVHCATNYVDEKVINEAKDILKEKNVTLHQIDIMRKPWQVFRQFVAYKQIIAVLKNDDFIAVHCHTPMGGVLGRLAARKFPTCRVLYTAHGFHFYKGCPVRNTLIYKTVERNLAKYTDALITINQEDYLAAQHFKMRGRAYYVHGVGVDLTRIQNLEVNKFVARKELGIPDQAIVFISVGEINKNKNHETALRAFHKANIKNSYYLICGVGPLQDNLVNLTNELGISDKVKFLGFRNDVKQILKVSDCFIFPSLREGLSVALMEAMAAGLPCIASHIRGNVDLLPESKMLFNPSSIDELASCMKMILQPTLLQDEVSHNLNYIQKYDVKNVRLEMKEIYMELLNNHENITSIKK